MAYSILIVDDDRTFVEELKSALQWNRLRITEVYTAFSVREAIAFLSKTKADIVLCDIEMPGGNGLQLLKWIRENHASMECIVLSSYAEFSYAQSALRFDVCDYLLKPIKAKELEETISRVLGFWMHGAAGRRNRWKPCGPPCLTAPSNRRISLVKRKSMA